MHIQINIPNTGGNNLQPANSQAEHARGVSPQADQSISQAAAHPAIQEHLAAAPGNMAEGEALCVAQDPQEFSNNRLMHAKWIQDDAQREAAYLSIAQDCNLSASYRLKAAKQIQDDAQRDTIYLSIAQDTQLRSNYRLDAAELIKDDTQRDAVCLSIAQDTQVYINDRLNAAKVIKDDTQRDAAYLSIAQDTQIRSNYRLDAAKVIKDDTQRDAAYLSIAQDTQVRADYRLDAAELIKDDTQRDAVCLSIAQDTQVYINDRLNAASLIVDSKIQEDSCSSIIKDILNNNGFRYTIDWMGFARQTANTQNKNLVITVICQKWPLVAEKQLQTHLETFRKLYELVLDDVVRTNLITVIVARTELNAGFRKAVVEEHVKDAVERERLLKAIEEGQEGSLNAPRTKKAR